MFCCCFFFLFFFTVFCFWLNNFTVNKDNTVLPKQNKHRHYKKPNVTLLREYIFNRQNLCKIYVALLILLLYSVQKLYNILYYNVQAWRWWFSYSYIYYFCVFSPVKQYLCIYVYITHNYGIGHILAAYVLYNNICFINCQITIYFYFYF